MAWNALVNDHQFCCWPKFQPAPSRVVSWQDIVKVRDGQERQLKVGKAEDIGREFGVIEALAAGRNAPVEQPARGAAPLERRLRHATASTPIRGLHYDNYVSTPTYRPHSARLAFVIFEPLVVPSKPAVTCNNTIAIRLVCSPRGPTTPEYPF
jgi:hypothetical protein